MRPIAWSGFGVAVLVASVMFVSAADAATVQVVGGSVVYQAAPGETNDVTANEPNPFTGELLFSDAGAPLTAGPGCTQTGASSATCTADPTVPLVVNTGDGNDQAAITAWFPRAVTAHGGGGNDQLFMSSQNGAPAELDGGAGDDSLQIGEQLALAPVLRGGAGDDTLRICCGSNIGGLEYGGAGDDSLQWFGIIPSDPSLLKLDGADGRDTYSMPPGLIPASAIVAGAGVDTLDERDQLRGGGIVFDMNGCSGCVERVFGTPSADQITGDARPQSIFGGDGDDVLDGGGGSDVISGQGGDDTIAARDGAIDAVGCGAGTDAVTADRFDLVDRDCETVSRGSAAAL